MVYKLELIFLFGNLVGGMIFFDMLEENLLYRIGCVKDVFVLDVVVFLKRWLWVFLIV